MDLWADFDSHIQDTFNRIIQVNTDRDQRLQTQLPVSMGGFGLRSAVTHGMAAFTSSIVTTEAVQMAVSEACSHTDITAALLHLEQASGTLLTKEIVASKSQKLLSLDIDLHSHNQLTHHTEESGSVRDIIRLKSLGLPKAGAWLNAVPSTHRNLNLRTQDFVIMARYRLGASIYKQPGLCPACDRPSDIFGDHAVSCGHEGDRIARHDHLRDAIFTQAAEAMLAPKKEERNLLNDTDARPADVLIPCWIDSKDAALDVTVTNPLQKSLANDPTREAGHALGLAMARKERQARAACERENLFFIPLAVETFGGWDVQALDTFKRISSALARYEGLEEGVVSNQFINRLSVQLMRDNAALLIGRKPTHPSPEVDGNM